MNTVTTLLFCTLLLSSCTNNGVVQEPITNAALRAKPLQFGMYVTPDPEQNPIEPPERFSGYHAAVDFEVSSGEVDGDVPIFAICTGDVRFSGYAEGYGGLLVQNCRIENQAVTVLYGHLQVDGLPAEETRLRAGQSIALLGAPDSYDSGYTRKHLHLGIHKGTRLDLRGYVQNESELEQYINPLTVLPEVIVDLPITSPGEIPYWQSQTGSIVE